MHPRQLLEENVDLIDRLVARACHRIGVSDVADAASMAKLALVENDYAILRRYEGRSSLATYLTIVIQRLLADEHARTHGRWRPSAEAQRMGGRAVLIEEIIGRQRRTIDEAMPIVRAADASITRAEVVAIADRLPRREPRPREVEIPADDAHPLPASESADADAIDRELREASRRTAEVLRETMASWPPQDRLLVRLRFGSSLSIADIARVMKVEQRPLYRRLESLLGRLREVLLAAGIDPSTAGDLIGAGNRIDVDFGFAWKNGEPRRTNETTEELS